MKAKAAAKRIIKAKPTPAGATKATRAAMKTADRRRALLASMQALEPSSPEYRAAVFSLLADLVGISRALHTLYFVPKPRRLKTRSGCGKLGRETGFAGSCHLAYL